MSTKLLAFTASRPSTNLVPEERFQLTKAQMKSDFIGVFNWQYSGDARKTMFKLALGAIMDAAMIPIGKPKKALNQEERSNKKNLRQALSKYDDQRTTVHLAQYTRLTKVNGTDPHFVLSLPVLHFTSVASLSTVVSLFGAGTPDNDAVSKLQECFDNAGKMQVPAPVALRRSHLPNDTLEMFKGCLKSVTYHGSKNLVVATLDFKISKLEAEALVSTDWVEIRPVDLYPLFVMWVEAEYVSRQYGKTSVSLSKIARTLPPHNIEDRRTDQYGLTVDLSGQPLYMPVECDNTDQYEAKYSGVGTKEDGTFALIDVTNQKPPVLPANIPILVDWVNFKFTYSNSAGRPVILPLENTRKCNASMAVNILNRPLPDKFFDRLVNYATACGVSSYVSMPSSVRDLEEVRGIQKILRQDQRIPAAEYFKRLVALDSEVTYKFRDLVEGNLSVMAPIRPFIMSLQPAMLNNIEALYSKYAVSTVIEALGLLGVMVYYGIPMGETQAAANQANKAALNQGVDPNWTPPDMPLVTANFSKENSGMLPHQAKVRNLLRESPDFAVLSVDAGGGKSMLSITDILYEIKAKRSAPYLIMCPSHLVANYVSELVEFTDGKVNVIPVTSYNIQTSGYQRYEEILERAPINTVLVVDYAVLKFRARSAVYGTASVSIYPVVEMIRKFRPGYCMLDESHFLKNAKSATFKGVMNLIADIPKKRIASGTLNPDSPSDLPAQIAIMDPTIFGTREDFNSTYGLEMSGNRVTRWRNTGTNSVGSAMAKLKKNVVWCQAKRKEWASALPHREDRFINCYLTDRQREVYDAIFDDMIQQIRKAAETDKNARKLLETLEGKKAGATDEDDFGDMGDDSEDAADDSNDIGPGLQPYLVDIERFVTNPGFHPYAKNGFVTADGKHIAPLTGDDLLPPKMVALNKLMLEDYKVMDPNNGKVLIFVNYTESAQAVFDSMPPELQACGILYSTANKTELVNKFKTDPKVRWMVGIRKSLEVGLNLQVASVLVRIEGVWTPGEQEQGDSRIARPYFGPGGDKRTTLKFDTLVADRTLDVTKAARLRAKMVALAKFENAGNPAYDSLEDIPILPMKLDVIQTMNDFSTNLEEYQSTMAQLNTITKIEYAEYAKELKAAGGFKFTQVKQAPTPEGCALLARVPYAQGTELYKADELGLVRVDNYLGMELGTDDEEGEDDGEEESTSSANESVRQRLLGLGCHTEYGDGVIVSVAFKGDIARRLTIRLSDGTTVNKIRATNAFIITRTETNSIDMRNKLVQASGMEATAPITVPGLNVKQTRVTQKELREAERRKEAEIKERQRQSLFNDKKKKSQMSVALQLNIVNGYLQIGFVPGKNEKVAKAMEAVGFKQNPSYYYTRIRTFKHLIAQAQKWADAGFHVGDNYDSGALAALSVALTQNGLQSHRHYSNLMGEAQFKNYMRDTYKPTADKKKLNLFALVTDGGWSDALNIKRAEKMIEDGGKPKPAYGLAYLCMPAGGGHPGSRIAIASKYVVPGTKWLLSSEVLTRFVGSVKGVHRVIQDMRDAGITVNNIDELNQYARSVKRIAPKIDDTVFNPEGDDGDDDQMEEAPTKPTRTVRTRQVQKPVKETPVPKAKKPVVKPKAVPKPTKPAKPAKVAPGRKSKSNDDWSLI